MRRVFSTSMTAVPSSWAAKEKRLVRPTTSPPVAMMPPPSYRARPASLPRRFV
jgi:hypothetical protein